jgi:hypothetical protein
LDDFRNDVPEDYLAGFPWHPHRGIETITYVLAGTVEHGDSRAHFQSAVLTSAGDRDAANEIRYLGRVSGTLAFSFAGAALLDNCASSEATWAHLVFRRRSRPALASDRDQRDSPSSSTIPNASA